MDRITVYILGGKRTPRSYSYALLSRVARKDRKIGRTVSRTYVYVHKCVAEECRIARRSHRTRCTQYARYVVRTFTCINVSQKSAESQDRIKPAALDILGTQDRTCWTQDLRIQQLENNYLETYAREHVRCVKFSQKSAEFLKNNMQGTDDRQDIFPSS